MKPRREVGRPSANWSRFFANWIQLANACQLNSDSNQSLGAKLAMLAVGNAANLPTELSPCSGIYFSRISVGGISPISLEIERQHPLARCCLSDFGPRFAVNRRVAR